MREERWYLSLWLIIGAPLVVTVGGGYCLWLLNDDWKVGNRAFWGWLLTFVAGWLSGLFEAATSFFSIRISLGIAIGSAVLLVGLWVLIRSLIKNLATYGTVNPLSNVDMQAQPKEEPPRLLSYTKDTFDGWAMEWEWVIFSSDHKYHIRNLRLVCSCGHDLVRDQAGIRSAWAGPMHYPWRCPACPKVYAQPTSEQYSGFESRIVFKAV